MIQYCVVATDKKTKEREMISGPYMTETVAEERRQAFMNNRLEKSIYRYFKIAKYPYRKRMEGTKSMTHH